MRKLEGKVVVVTGASRGIGQAIAELFGERGARVVCAARTRDEGGHMLEGSLARTVANIERRGGAALGVAADISEESECLRLIDEAREAFGPVDILVNNAALTYNTAIEDFATNRWKRAFAINLHAPFILSREVLKDMRTRGGAIVSISSDAAAGPGRGPYAPGPHRLNTMYGASKAALERFTQGLAQEVAQYPNVAVASVAPSLVVVTPGTVHHGFVCGPDDPNAEPPDIMARAVLLLASEPAETVNGRVTYSQQILKELGWIEEARGRGVDRPGSGYSRV